MGPQLCGLIRGSPPKEKSSVNLQEAPVLWSWTLWVQVKVSNQMKVMFFFFFTVQVLSGSSSSSAQPLNFKAVPQSPGEKDQVLHTTTTIKHNKNESPRQQNQKAYKMQVTIYLNCYRSFQCLLPIFGFGKNVPVVLSAFSPAYLLSAPHETAKAKL